MRQLLRVLGSLSAASLLVIAAGANAQATRTWVSGVGDDANPCSRTAPCKTFAGAISKTAAAGVISVVDPGGFGTLTITKSITIDGGGVEGSVVASFVPGFTVNAAASDQVILRNLTLYGVGNGTSGIRVLSAAKVVVEHVDISGFDVGIEQASTAIVDVHDSYLYENRSYGMLITAPAGRTVVERTRLVDKGSFGLRLEGAGMVSVLRSTASGNAVAVSGFAGAGACAYNGASSSAAIGAKRRNMQELLKAGGGLSQFSSIRRAGTGRGYLGR